MKKRTITIILLLLLSIGIISLYTTFAYNEEDNHLDKSMADYNLIYSLKEKSNHQITIESMEEKYLTINLSNPYESTVKYGMYYYLINPKKTPNNFTITLAEDSKDLLENTIKSNQKRTITLKITNNSENQVELLVGALVGFENGDINDLAKDGEILIK